MRIVIAGAGLAAQRCIQALRRRRHDGPITLLGDSWLNPGATGLLVPFAMDYEPVFTGLGVIAGYLAAVLGLSFYLRRRIGAKRWRNVHRLTPLVYLLGVIHVLGAGSDASAPWLRAVLFATGAPILFLFLARVLPEGAPARTRPEAS